MSAGSGPAGINDHVTLLLPTLIANGFVPQQVHRRPGYLEVACSRADEFGAAIPYLIALADSTLAASDASSLGFVAERRHAQLVVIGDAPAGLAAIPWDTFIAR